MRTRHALPAAQAGVAAVATRSSARTRRSFARGTRLVLLGGAHGFALVPKREARGAGVLLHNQTPRRDTDSERRRGRYCHRDRRARACYS
jgi:hypothetical protein